MPPSPMTASIRWPANSEPGAGAPARSLSLHPSSRTEITPLRSANSTSRTRFWFWGRSAIPNFSKSARRWPLTASTREEDLVGDLLVGRRRRVLAAIAKRAAQRDQDPALGVAELGAAAASGAATVAELGEGRGRGRPRSSRRSAARRRRRAGAGPRPGRRSRTSRCARARRRRSSIRRRSRSISACSRETLLVGVEADVDLGAAADGDPVAALLEREDPLAVRPRQNRNGRPSALGLEPLRRARPARTSGLPPGCPSRGKLAPDAAHHTQGGGAHTSVPPEHTQRPWSRRPARTEARGAITLGPARRGEGRSDMTRRKLNSYARRVLAAVSGLAVVVATSWAPRPRRGRAEVLRQEADDRRRQEGEGQGHAQGRRDLRRQGRPHGSRRQGRRPGLHRARRDSASPATRATTGSSGGAARDDIDGGAGDDLIEGGAGRNYLDGGVGDDRDDRRRRPRLHRRRRRRRPAEGRRRQRLARGGDDNDNLDGGETTTASTRRRRRSPRRDAGADELDGSRASTCSTAATIATCSTAATAGTRCSAARATTASQTVAGRLGQRRRGQRHRVATSTTHRRRYVRRRRRRRRISYSGYAERRSGSASTWSPTTARAARSSARATRRPDDRGNRRDAVRGHADRQPGSATPSTVARAAT